MIKAKYTLGDKSTTIEFQTIEQLLEYERAQKDESYQSLPDSFDKEAFHKKGDEIKASREMEIDPNLYKGLNLGGNSGDSATDRKMQSEALGWYKEHKNRLRESLRGYGTIKPGNAKIEKQIKELKEKARAIRKDLKRGVVPTKTIPDLTLYLVNQITKLKL